MLELKSLFNTLSDRGMKTYDVVAMPDGKWRLNDVSDAKLVRFTGKLGVYYDETNGYEIVRLDRFSQGQLIAAVH